MRVSEKEWSDFKVLKKQALERYCSSILSESAAICANTEQSSHERYLDLYELIDKRNRAMANAFDGHSRSRARYQLRVMHSMGLITDDDLQRFGMSES